ncbi:MAG TPA: hypothetical protein VG347_08780 [Verrucomicrobiae bacterium]|nr:hypothetical protein [Verrucomicrobiae bacterium]
MIKNTKKSLSIKSGQAHPTKSDLKFFNRRSMIKNNEHRLTQMWETGLPSWSSALRQFAGTGVPAPFMANPPTPVSTDLNPFQPTF